METMIVGSLFTGIGGLDPGLERAGMEVRWMVEIESFCQEVLTKHWPNVRKYGDVRDCGRHNLEPVDLICGGFPCQPHSTAGKRRGEADDRNLWPEYLRIVTELRPTWILGENVPGIITTMLNTVLSDLEDAGYETLPLVIPACALDAPHRRDRIWILAHSTGERDGEKSRGVVEGERETWIDPPKKFSCGSQITPTACLRRCKELHGYTWPVEPRVGRVANGIPNRMDRLRTLGNAVVPQVAEWIGELIVRTHQLSHEAVPFT